MLLIRILYNQYQNFPQYPNIPINNQLPVQPNNIYYNQNIPSQAPKKSSLTSIIVVIVLIMGAVFLVNGMTKYNANMHVGNLLFYVPKSWDKVDSNAFESPTKACNLVIGMLTIDYETAYDALKVTMDSNSQKVLNRKEWDYFYSEKDNQEMHVYLIDDELGQFLATFYKKNDSDEECNSYIKHFEKAVKITKYDD